jgi:Fe-S oxidoreductase
VEVLETAGYQVQVPQNAICCGRPLYDFGMLDTAKRWLYQTLDTLRPQIEAGTPVVILEPSCLAVFRDELIEILPHHKDAERLRNQAFLLSEFLEKNAPGLQYPQLNCRALVWGHCHHRSVAGMGAEEAVLQKLGIDYQIATDATCCGMAGSFGFEHDHYQVAQQIGELGILPRARSAEKNTIIVADGFSCQTQIQQGETGRQALHLAQVVKMALDKGATGLPPGSPPEVDYPKVRPGASPIGDWLVATALIGLGATIVGSLLLRKVRT